MILREKGCDLSRLGGMMPAFRVADFFVSALFILALCLVVQTDVHGAQVQSGGGSYAVDLTDGEGGLSSIHSEDPNDYVKVRHKKFVLRGVPFVIKGTNYFGGWLFHHTIDAGNGIEQDTPWALYHDLDSQKLDVDFRFIRSQLKATAVRIGTPAKDEFSPLVQYHDYKPWYGDDGAITERYKEELIELADHAYANGIRIQFCLLWNIGGEIAKDPEAFKRGGQMDRFYSNQVMSIATALRNHPGVIGYSIGNEVLVNWPINGTHTSPFEGQAAGFIVRRLQEVRSRAPRQLLATDEVTASKANQWYEPGPEFVVLSGVDIGHGAQSVRLADIVDYLGTHFYPETMQPEDLSDGFASKIADSEQQLAIYLQKADAVGKPVVLNEFGLPPSTTTIASQEYGNIRDRFYLSIIAKSQKLGVQGLLAWDAIPHTALIPGRYVILPSKVNTYSPIEVDIDEPEHAPHRVLFYQPAFHLFQWHGDLAVPSATVAAKAIASAWPNIPQPRLPRR
jgi:hypothetical protein